MAELQAEFDALVKELGEEGLPPEEANKQALATIEESGLDTSALWVSFDLDDQEMRGRMEKCIAEITEVGAGERAVDDAIFGLNALRLACRDDGDRGTRATGFVSSHGLNAIAGLLAVRAEEKEDEDEGEEEESDDEDEEELVEKAWSDALDVLSLLLSKSAKAARLMTESSMEAVSGLLVERDYDRPLMRKILPVLRALCAPGTGAGGSKVRQMVVEGGSLEVLKKLVTRLEGDERNAALVSEVQETIAAIEAR